VGGADGLPGTEACLTDFFPHQSLLDEERRVQLWAHFEYMLDPDSNLLFYGELQTASNFIDRGNSPSYGFVNVPTVPIENPGLRYDFFQRGIGGEELIDDAAAQALGFANAVEAATANPMVGPMLFQGRPYTDVTEVYTDGDGRFDNTGEMNRDKSHFVAGLSGNLPWQSWTFDLASTWSQHKFDGYAAYDTNDPNLELALQGFGGRDCNPNTGQAGVAPCFYFNPYGSGYLADASDTGPNGLYNTDDMYLDLFDPIIGSSQQELWVLEGVVTGEVFDLPAGPLGVAVGAQYRDQSFKSEPSGTAQNFDFSFVVGGEAFSVKRDVWAAFGELLIPVTGTDSAVGPLEISTAIRYEDYGGDTGSTTDPKIALLWMPIEALSIRGSFQTSFKAPGLAQLGGSSTSLNNVPSDPFDPASAQVFIPGIATGNPNLQPEEADVFNVGFSWQPTAGVLDGLQVNVDYWSFEFENAIRKESNVSVIEAFVAEVEAGIVNGPAARKLTLNSDGTIAVIRSDFINAASVDSNGIDLSLRYPIDTQAAGLFEVFWNSSHIEEYQFQESPTGLKIDGLGKRNFQTIGSPAPKWRANAGFDWLLGNHSANVTLRYTDNYDMGSPPSAIIALLNNRTPSTHIDDMLTVDLQYNYQIPELFGMNGPTLTFGVINAFNEEPPTIDDGPGFDTKIHDPRGRVMYGRIVVQL
jgi:outer membrane receptor protein involved in Fe transport